MSAIYDVIRDGVALTSLHLLALIQIGVDSRSARKDDELICDLPHGIPSACQGHLKTLRHLCGTVGQGYLSDSDLRSPPRRFVFVKTLGQAFMADKIPYPRRPKQLPVVLSQQEITRLLDAARSLKHRALMMVLYGAGLRVSEACQLEPADIDSHRMAIHVRQGKEQKDRDVMLSAVLLDTLRQYWKSERPTPWLFPGKDPVKPMTTKAVFLDVPPVI